MLSNAKKAGTEHKQKILAERREQLRQALQNTGTLENIAPTIPRPMISHQEAVEAYNLIVEQQKLHWSSAIYHSKSSLFIFN